MLDCIRKNIIFVIIYGFYVLYKVSHFFTDSVLKISNLILQHVMCLIYGLFTVTNETPPSVHYEFSSPKP